MKTILITELLQDNCAYNTEQGKLMYETLKPYVKSKTPIKLDFTNIRAVTSTFIAYGFLQFIYSTNTPFTDLQKIITIENYLNSDLWDKIYGQYIGAFNRLVIPNQTN